MAGVRRRLDSYLQTMEANTLADPEVDTQDEPPSQDDESEYKSTWLPPGPNGKKEVPNLEEVETLSCEAVKPCLMVSQWDQQTC